MATNAAELEKPTGEYRQYLPDLNLPRFQVMCTQDAHEYAHAFKTGKQPPWLHALYTYWLELFQEPYKGVTNDGKDTLWEPAIRISIVQVSNIASGRVRPDLFTLQDEEVPIQQIVDATQSLLGELDAKQTG